MDLTPLFGDFAADILQKILAGGPHFLDFYGIYVVIAWYLHGGLGWESWNSMEFTW